MADGLVEKLREITPPETAVPPARDVRARRPGLLHGSAEAARQLARVVVLLVLDAVGVFLAIFTAHALKEAILPAGDFTLMESVAYARDFSPLAILVTLLLFARSRLYGGRAVRPGFSRVVAGLFQVTLISLVYTLVEDAGIGNEDFRTYYIFWGTLFFAIFYVGGFRWVFERLSGILLRAVGIRRRAMLVGTSAQVQAVAHALGDSDVGIDPVGFVSLTPQPDNGLPSFGSVDGLERHFGSIDEVLLADPEFPQAQAVDLVERCHAHGVRVRVAPSTMEILMDRVEFVPGQTLPLFELKPPVFEGVDFIVKRTFDLAVAAGLVLVLSPLLAGIALAVRLTSRGPVIYRSVRPGIGGRPFACLKFRTMLQDAERRQAELEALNEQQGAIFKIRQDPRVTRVGRFLRRWSLDELPQLFNVLRGDMSLIGPRPLPQRDYDRLEEWHRKRYLVLPGITGLWQVSGRSELDFDELVRLDFLYLERWSVFLDMSILLKTVPAILRSRGAW
ncbi:MAG: sugar transferase [Thermoleophilaceae bacterium]|nr:sugar transferase [Thermoleophilaceae bacterium]